MSNAEYRYAAFISYRHVEPDMTVAKRLHTLIETYHIPSAIRKSTGKTKMGRVFRDQEELPLSSDLGGDITKALQDSEWLIVICTPALLESKWCMKEIDTFIGLGRRDHILTVLVSGDPQTSFPPQLRFVTIDGQKVEKEPLAANVVDDSPAARLKKLKNESLRLLAPMLNVSYDDLKQRARERRLKTIMTASLAALLVVGGFLTYAIIQNRAISAQRNEALTSQSLYLADAALRVDEQGDHSLGLLLALQGLPDDPDNPSRPIVEQASNALLQLLYNGGSVGSSAADSYSSVAIVTTANEIIDYTVFNDSQGNSALRIATNDPTAYIQDYSLTTGSRQDGFDNALFTSKPDNIVLRPSGSVSAFYYGDRVDFLRKDGTVFSATLPEKEDTDREYSWTLADSKSSWSLDYELYYRTDGSYQPKIVLLLGDQPIKISEIYAIYGALPAAGASDHPTYLIGGYGGGDHQVNLLLWDAKTQQNIRTYQTPGQVRVLAASADGTYFAASCYSFDYDLQKNVGSFIFGRTSDGEILLSLENTALDGSVAAAIGFAGSESDKYFYLITEKGTLMIFDYATMSFVSTFTQTGYTVSAAEFSSDASQLLLTCSDNYARLIDRSGNVSIQLTCANTLEKASFAEDDAIILLESFNAIQIYSAVKPDNSYSIVSDLTRPLNSEVIGSAFSPDSSVLALLYSKGELRVYDSQTGEIIYSDNTGMYNFPSWASSAPNMIAFSPDGSQLLYPISDSSIVAENVPTVIRVVATSDWQTVTEFTPSYRYAQDQQCYLNEMSLVFSADGKYLVTLTSSGTSVMTVFETKDYTPLWNRGYSEKVKGSYENLQDFGDAVDIDTFFAFNDSGNLVVLYTFADGYDSIVGGWATLAVLDIKTGQVKSTVDIAKYSRIALKDDGSMLAYSLDSQLSVITPANEKVYTVTLPNKIDDKGLRFSTIDGYVCAACQGSYLLADYKAKTLTDLSASSLEWHRYNLSSAKLSQYSSIFFSESVNINGYIYDNSRIEMKINGTRMYLYRTALIDADTGVTFLNLTDSENKAVIIAVSADGNKICYKTSADRDTYIIALPTLAEAIQASRTQLNGRQLTASEKAAYFIVQ